MRRILWPLLVLASGLVAGCDPAPSVPLAPDQKPPDTSKMSSADMDRMIKQNAPPSTRSR